MVERFVYGNIYFARRSQEFCFVKVSMSQGLKDFRCDPGTGAIQVGFVLQGFEVTGREIRISLN